MSFESTLPLKSLVRICGGKRLPAGKALQTEPNNHPYIRVRDVGQRELPKQGLEYVPDELFPPISRYIVETNDVVLSIVGTIGALSIVDQHYHLASLTENCVRLNGLDKQDALYLYYYLKSQIGQFEIAKGTVGAVQPKLPIYNIEKIPVPWPDRLIRQSISSLLCSLDDRIALLCETNTTLEAIAQALFKSWFVDFDPVRAKQEGREPEGMDADTAALFPDSFEESELGLVPKGWKVGVLGDIAVSIRKQIPTSELNTELSYIGLEHIPRQSLSICNWDNAQGLESAKAAFSKGDILFGKLRPYFHKVIIAPFEGVCSTDILVCRSKQSTYYGIITMHLFSVKLVEYANRLSNGAKMPRVNWKDIAAYTICIPSSTIAKKYSNVVIPLFERMMANVHTTKTLESLRDTLLPRLISGQLRIPEAETIIEEATV